MLLHCVLRLGLKLLFSTGLIILLIWLWSTMVPAGPLVIDDTDTMELRWSDGRFEVEVPADYIQLPTSRIDFGYRMFEFTDEDPVAVQIARFLMENVDNDKDRARAAAWVVEHNIEYESDIPFDNWQLPWETVAKGTGDCEDMSILLASILRSMGMDAVLIKERDHVLVGVAVGDGPWSVEVNGKTYYSLEPQDTTYPGAIQIAPLDVYGENKGWMRNAASLIYILGILLLSYAVLMRYDGD